MRRSIHRGLLLLVLATLPAWACGSSDDDTTTPTQPTPTTTETFSGNVNQNGAVTFPFAVQSSGTITATLTSLEPLSTLPIGMSLGTWNGSACTVAIANDSATQGVAVSGTVSAAGNYCVRVYDVGNIQNTVSVTVQVVHP